MKGLVAHLHPLLVHLPIGILLLSGAIAWLGRREKYAHLLPAFPVVQIAGATAAVASCLSGWLLGSDGGYDQDTIFWHQWLGIATAFSAVLACFVPQKRLFTALSVVALLIAGHLGGTLTHGENYLSTPITDATPQARPENVQEALAYSEVIAPIFKEKCQSCHNSAKQKGGLRLDSPEQILKGGKNGTVVKPGDPINSDLIRRCLLRLGNDDHMPPKERPQLTSAELEILQWWVTQGADFQKKTKELPQNLTIQKALASWQTNAAMPEETPDYPLQAGSPALPDILARLKRTGVLVMPVNQGSNWLSVNFINLPNPQDSIFLFMEKIAGQTVWLKLNNANIPAAAWNSIGKMTELRRLSLEGSNVTDTDLSQLANAQNLQFLNLSSTQISEAGLRSLVGLKKLTRLYLYKTRISPSADIASLLPGVQADTGGYSIPFIASDTVRLKDEKKY